MFRYFAATSVLTMSMAGALVGTAPAMATTISPEPKPHNSHESHPKPHKAQHKPHDTHSTSHKSHSTSHKSTSTSHKSQKSHKSHKSHSKIKGSIKSHKGSDNDKFSNKSVHYCVVYVLSVVADGPIRGHCTHTPWQENEGDESEVGGG